MSSNSACGSCGAPRVGTAVFCFQCGAALAPLAPTAVDANPSFRPIVHGESRILVPALQPVTVLDSPEAQKILAQVRFDKQWDYGALLLLGLVFLVAAAVVYGQALAWFTIPPGMVAFGFYWKRRKLLIPYKGSELAAVAGFVAAMVVVLSLLGFGPFSHNTSSSTPTTPAVTNPGATTPTATTPATTTPTTAPTTSTPSATIPTQPSGGRQITVPGANGGTKVNITPNAAP
jgi:hypothetical protein